jgi:RNA-directed DNA polymerase
MNEDENSSCALPHHTDNWHTIAWRKVIQRVSRLQRRIAKAVKEGRWGKVKALIYLVSKSFYAKLLAVFRVTTNKGGNTPGVDNTVWLNGYDKLHAAKNLKTRGYSPIPLRAQCFLSLCRKTSAQWVFEADIKSCFDEINHDWIMDNIPLNKIILRKWLKAGYIEKKRLFPISKGTPQGGIISPTIMNMVLDGMETALKKQFPRWKGQKVNFIRYADDFIITASSEELIKIEIIPMVKDFLKVRGLQLSEDKSNITHINEGFDFLSQYIRKYKGKLVILPFKDSVRSFKDKIKSMFKNNRGIPAHGLIRLLNPVIRGWSNYHKGICAKRTFAKLGTFIYGQLKRWAKYQHGNKNRWWIYWRYFVDKHFTDKRAGKKGIQCHRLYRISYVPIRYHVKIKSNANPYLPDFDKYFFQRLKWRVDLAKECKQITTFDVKETKINSRVSLRRESLKSA